MKTLTSYEGEDAIELWADLLEPFTKILGDEDIAGAIKAKKPVLLIAKDILKTHKAEASEILLKIDDTPLNGLNIITRLIALLVEISKDESIMTFFNFAEPVKTDNGSFGSAMGNTEDGEN